MSLAAPTTPEWLSRMLPEISWKRLRETRWVQALLVYLAVAWLTADLRIPVVLSR